MQSKIEDAVTSYGPVMQRHDGKIQKDASKHTPAASKMIKVAVAEVVEDIEGATPGDVLRVISRKFSQLVHLGPLIKKDLDAEEALEAAKRAEAEAATQAAEAAAAAAAAATAAAGTGNSGTSLSGGNIDFKPTTTSTFNIGAQGGNAELIAKMEMMEVKVAAMTKAQAEMDMKIDSTLAKMKSTCDAMESATKSMTSKQAETEAKMESAMESMTSKQAEKQSDM
jgi:hypothetical protein